MAQRLKPGLSDSSYRLIVEPRVEEARRWRIVWNLVSIVSRSEACESIFNSEL